jgi:hypothetical protein
VPSDFSYFIPYLPDALYNSQRHVKQNCDFSGAHVEFLSQMNNTALQVMRVVLPERYCTRFSGHNSEGQEQDVRRAADVTLVTSTLHDTLHDAFRRVQTRSLEGRESKENHNLNLLSLR